jgi:biotin operon repressor
MLTENKTSRNLMKILLKEFYAGHTVSSLAQQLGISRVGIWKALKRLESDKMVVLSSIGKGKTSTYSVILNWDNFLVEKTLALSLAEEAIKQQRWRFNFTELEKHASFILLFGSILHSPKEAKDIDLLAVVGKNDFKAVNEIVSKIQQTQPKKIHFIDLTEGEFEQELRKKNKAYIDALSKCVVLYGQENFVQFIRKLQTK